MGPVLPRIWPPGPGPGQLLRASPGRSSAGPDWARDRSCTWIRSGENPWSSAHVRTDSQQVRGRSGQVRADLGQGGPDQAQAWGRSRGPGPDIVCPICLRSLVFLVFPLVFLVLWGGFFGFFGFFGFGQGCCSRVEPRPGLVQIWASPGQVWARSGAGPGQVRSRSRGPGFHAHSFTQSLMHLLPYLLNLLAYSIISRHTFLLTCLFTS